MDGTWWDQRAFSERWIAKVIGGSRRVGFA